MPYPKVFLALRFFVWQSFSLPNLLLTSSKHIPVCPSVKYCNHTQLIQQSADLHAIMTGSNPLSQRAFNIASYSLCGFANLGALGIQIGVLGALAPSQAKVIVRVATSAMICGFISTLQTAGIA